MELEMIVNDKPVSIDVKPNAFLADVLRYQLGLTGTKIGCQEAECGICTVLVNGTPANSCIYPAVKANGARVETIEGLAHDGQLHPLQQAFIDHGAVQCGFCTSGLIMTSKALLDRNPAPTDDDIKHALKDTYCRCTGYVSVINAIQDAARHLRPQTADRRRPTLPQTKEPLNIVGRPLPRPDAIAKVTGEAKYTDDYVFPNMLYGATLRAGIPHALIKRIDASKAKALPGVAAVITHEDVPGKKNHGLVIPDWPALCHDKVRYVGDAVAVVAAETPEIAQQALSLIEVEYEPLPVVNSPQKALEPDAPKVHESGNLLKHIKVRKGDVEQGFARADVIVERTFHTAFTDHAFLEPECSIGRVAGDPHGRIEVYVGSQIPYQDRAQIAACLNVPEDRVRVIGTLIGGGFGGKEDIMGQIHAALLAKITGRPVKVLYSRHESLVAHPKRHATTIRVKIGARRDGHITATEAELWGDTGAYASLGEKVLTRATTHAAGPYDVPNVKIDCYATYTNNPPAGAFRGFGVTQSCFAVESTMDELARELSLDAIELRRINALRVGSVTNTGQLLRESVGLLECLDKVEKEIERQEELDGTRGKKRAWGLACAYKNTGLGGGAPDKAGAELEVYADGHAEIRTSSAELGQGLPGVLAAITAEELGLPFERISVLLSDTALTPNGGPTTASRQTFVSGNAARHASIQMREVLTRAAAERLDAPPEQIEFANGQVCVRRNGHAEPCATFADVVQWAQEESRPTRLTFEYEAPKTQPLGTGGDMHVAFSYAVQAALVEVNTETGQVQVLKIIAAHDIGRAINPLSLEGQIEGGIVMGLGNALTEEYIVENGVPYTQWFSRYKMPSIRHAPEIVSFIVEDPVAAGPYGAKGVGEVASIPTTPAITNAIYNAIGVRVYSLPVDQDWLLRQIKPVLRDQ